MITKVISKSDQKRLLQQVESNNKYTAIILIFLDAGLRVTECASLKLSNLDFVHDLISINSLKKRKTSSKKVRDIPMTQRLREALIIWVGSLDSKGKDSYVFPTNSKTGHISRSRIWRYIKKVTGGRYTTHDLRHTFATTIEEKYKDVRMVQALLGHERQTTTEIYLHKTLDKKREAIRTLEKVNFFRRLFKKKKSNDLILIDYDEVKCHVGRSKEIKKMTEAYDIKQNLILIGPQGVGKSHLLDRVKGDKVIRLDDFKSVKTTLVSLTKSIALNHNREGILSTFLESDDTVARVERKSIKFLIDCLMSMTNKNEFTLVISDLTDVTKTGVRAIEQLKNHFHIMTAARMVKIDYVSMLTNFERIDMEVLDRKECYHLISKQSVHIHDKIQDYFVFRDHIYEQSGGNPQFAIEMIDRYSKMKVIDLETIRDSKHATALKDIDMSLIMVLALSSLMVLRYVGSEVGDSGAYRLLGGVFLLFALFARPLLMSTKRKFF